jgi:hypothetical protein
MHILPTSASERRRLCLVPIKTYAALAPVFLLAASTTRFYGGSVIHLVSLLCLGCAVILIREGLVCKSTPSRKGMISDFIFAGIALIWFIMIEIVEPATAMSC